jgi:hypothetical protein
MAGKKERGKKGKAKKAKGSTKKKGAAKAQKKAKKAGAMGRGAKGGGKEVGKAKAAGGKARMNAMVAGALPGIPMKTPKEADKKLVEWRKSLMAPAERAMIEFFLYPVAKNRGEKQAAKRVVVESYLKGDEVVRQFILFLAHEQLSRAAGLRMMHNFAHFRKLMPKDVNAGEVRKAVYRSMFNYTTSLEGLAELAEFLGELGDEGAAKLLSYHLSYHSSTDSPGLQIMRNAVIDALGECRCTYALDALISYAKYSERPTRAAYALNKWEKKLGKAGLSAEEKKEYAKEIAKIMGRKEKHEYYR